MNKSAKPLPRFETEAQERAYWETEGRDSTQYLDWTKAQRSVLPNLKPSTKTISLRLPQHLTQTFHDLVGRRVRIATLAGQPLPGSTDSGRLIDGQLLGNGEVHGQMQERIATTVGCVEAFADRVLGIVQERVVFRVGFDPVGGDCLDRRQGLTGEALLLRVAEEATDVMLRGVEHAGFQC